MATSLINNIYDDFTFIYANGPQSIINFFSRNTIAFNNLTTFDNDSDLHLYIKLACHYSDSLYQKGRFKEVIDVTTKALSIQNERKTLNNLKDEWHYSLLLYKGMAICNLRDFKTATPIFKALVNSDPKNEKYRKWLNQSLYGQKRWIINLVWIISATLMLTDFIFSKAVPAFKHNLYIPIFIIILAFGNYLYELNARRSFRKYKNSK